MTDYLQPLIIPVLWLVMKLIKNPSMLSFYGVFYFHCDLKWAAFIFTVTWIYSAFN